jgi:hypothetical protein
MPRLLSQINGVGGTHGGWVMASRVVDTGAQLILAIDDVPKAALWADTRSNIGFCNHLSTSGESNSIFIGVHAGDSSTSGDNSIFIGYDADGVSPTNSQVIAIGSGARAASNAVAVGSGSVADSPRTISFGQQAIADAPSSVALGADASASGNYSLAIGRAAVATSNGCVAIGTDNIGGAATSDVANDFVLGTTRHTVRVPGSAVVSGTVDAALGFRHGPTTPSWTTGTGTPEGALAAPIGSIYSRLDGSPSNAVYHKETGGTGNTGWVAAGTGGGGGTGAVDSVDGRTGEVILSDLYVDVTGDTMTGNLGLGFPSPTAKLQFAAATGATGGILFGTDTNLFRSAANTLRTGNLDVVGAVRFSSDGVTTPSSLSTAGGNLLLFTGTYPTAQPSVSDIVMLGGDNTGDFTVDGTRALYSISSIQRKHGAGALDGTATGAHLGAGRFNTINHGTGNVTNATGITIGVEQRGVSGVIANLRGMFVARAGAPGAGVVSNAMGFHVQNMGLSNTANSYGMLIDAQSGSTSGSYGLLIGAATTATLFLSHNTDTTGPAGGIYFGVSRDTYLYRSAAKTLTTGNLDLNKNELRNPVSHKLAAAPSSPVEGQWYYDTALRAERFWDGTKWVTPGAGMPPGGLTNQTLTKATDTDYDTRWADLPTNWERFVSVPLDVTANPNETVEVDVVTFTAGATGQMIADLIVQLDWVSGGSQLTAANLGPSSPGPTTYPGPGIIEDVGITVLPVTAMWDNVTAGDTITLRIELGVGAGPSPVKIGQCYGSYRIAGAADSGAYLPVGGTAGQVLTKDSTTNFDTSWAAVPKELPAGGGVGQVLAKTSATDYAVAWQPIVSGVSSVDSRTGAVTLTDKYLQLTGGTLGEAAHIVLGTTTGTMIGTANAQKLGFWGALPITRNTGWSVVAGYSAQKVYNPQTTTLAETARVLGTLVDALKACGLVGA